MRRTLPLIAVVIAAAACHGKGGGPASENPPLSQLTLSPDKRVVVVGEFVELATIAIDASGNDVSAGVTPVFTSSDTHVVEVSGTRLTARAAGTATIKADAGGKTAQATIYVGLDSYDLDRLGAPRVIGASYIDLSKIERFSRFRSLIGHSYTDGSESCRSMKHYFQPRTDLEWTSVDIFAPVDGTVFTMAADGSFGVRLLIRPRDLPVLQIALFHVAADPAIRAGSWITAGTRIGHHSSSQTMSDIAVSIGPKEGGHMLSLFEAMTDSLFQQFQSRGVSSRDAAIITKAERDADPVSCVGENPFLSQGTIENWLVLK